MKQAALRDAKRPGHAFAPDSEQKQREAGARLKEICERKLAGLYLRLESQRGFSRLRKALLEDAALQRRVFAEPDEEALVRLLAAIAERSLVVSPDNVRTELREERRCWFERFVR
jgi:predicted DNA-binding transcriptional regulator YafY